MRLTKLAYITMSNPLLRNKDTLAEMTCHIAFLCDHKVVKTLIPKVQRSSCLTVTQSTIHRLGPE